MLFAPLTSFWTVSKVFLIRHFKCTTQLSLRKIFFLLFADWAFPEKVHAFKIRIQISGIKYVPGTKLSFPVWLETLSPTFFGIPYRGKKVGEK